MKDKYGPAALDPNNPRHHHAMSLPGEFYMDGEEPMKLPPQTPEQAARLQAGREQYQRDLAEWNFPFKRKV